ncbi:MAG: FAD-binding oxidoreductase [Maritimibacter sp.]
MTSLTPADSAFEARLRAVVPEAAFRPLTARYLEEPRGLFFGQGGLLVAPATIEEVAAVIRAANGARVGVVPYGGGTGLVGGQVMGAGPAPVILSLERMDKIRSIHPSENVLIAEAGAILADVQQAAEQADRLFPLSLASEGSARVGGALSTNAGGVNVLRYGNARELCLGLEAVLPDGTIWHGLRRLRKDNTGYDLRGLMVGAEGSLGVITAASLRLFARPQVQACALMEVVSPDAALEFLAMARRDVGEAISAFELLSRQGLEFLAETGCEARCPLTPLPEWSVLVDLGLGAQADGEGTLLALYEAGVAAGVLRGGVVASSQAQRVALWAMREMIPQANRRIGAISSHDISLPLSAIPDFLKRGAQLVAALGGFRINAFGHLGDGNLHYNVFPPKGASKADFASQRAEIAGRIYDLVADYDGSFSAEHGIGRLKVADLARLGDPAKLAAMRAIKTAFDPNGIMNPGVML